MVRTAPCIFKKKLLRWLVGLQVEVVASQHSLQVEEEVGDGGWSVSRLKKKLMKLLAACSLKKKSLRWLGGFS